MKPATFEVMDPAAGPGVPRPIAWWSDARLEAIARRLSERWSSWADGWGLSLASTSASNASELTSMHWYMRFSDARGGEQAWLGGDGCSLDACLIPAIFGAGAKKPVNGAAGQAFAVLDGMGARAASSLQELARQSITDGGCVAPGEMAAGRSPTAWLARWSGAVAVVFDIEGLVRLRLCLLCSPAAIRDMRLDVDGPWRVPPPHPLAGIGELLSETPIRVAAELLPAEFPIGHVLSLRIGDFIRVPHGVDEPLLLVERARTPDDAHSPLCRGRLGAIGGRSCVALASIPQTTSPSKVTL